MELIGRNDDSGVRILELREDSLDASNVRAFRELADALIGEHRHVVLDMAGVRFIDSSGLGALIASLRRLNGRDGDLVLCEMSRTVRALFELMRMHRVFKIRDSRADALAAFDPAAG